MILFFFQRQETLITKLPIFDNSKALKQAITYKKVIFETGFKFRLKFRRNRL